MELIAPERAEMTVVPATSIPETAFAAIRYGNVTTLNNNDNKRLGKDATEETPPRALDRIDRDMDENALSAIAASCSVDLDRPKADIEKTRRPAPRTTRTVERAEET
jgi:hypothetical protein